ncbi:MAG: SapC family protein [Burkholderiaceae bacterium]
MIITNFHAEPTALDTVLHRGLRLNTNLSAVHKLAPFTSFMITLAEFADASRDFPILFVRAAADGSGKERVAPVAVFGLKPGENLFADGDRWSGSYLPAMLRAYPFTMARIEGSDRWAMVFDNAWAGFSRTEGSPLFDGKGEATELLANVHKFVQEFEADIDRTRQACEILMELKLLKPMRFDATMSSGETLSVDGFMTLDEDAIRKLPDKQIADLHRNGLLGVVQTHHVSLGNMRRLLDRRAARKAS